jgi:uncharacterized membrane protein
MTIARRAVLSTVVLVLLVPALAGCLYYHRWSRPGATEQEFYQDSMRCHRTVAPGWCTGVGWGSGCDQLARNQREAVERACCAPSGVPFAEMRTHARRAHPGGPPFRDAALGARPRAGFDAETASDTPFDVQHVV